MSRKFDRLLDIATDSTNLEPNWDAIIDCFDSVRAGEIPAKVAIGSIQKRIQHENPHVVHHALLVLDACVKNCGPKFHAEIATREFMEFFKNIPIENKYDQVKTKTLEMLQCWAMAFANKPEYKIVVDTHNLLKLAGFDFPSIKEADAMFLAQVAPDWVEGPECFRCRAEFGLLTRKHHCRACGQIFCDRCSNREMPLPQFGIEKAVRVCEACYEKGIQRHNEKLSQSRQSVQEKKIMEKLGEVISPAEKEKLLQEKEEEDLAKALQLSKIEAEKKDKQEKTYHSLYNGDSTSFYPADQSSASSHADLGYKGAASVVPESPSELSIAADDPLARYMNRDYWQQRKAQNKVEEWATQNNASAPTPSDMASVATMSIAAEEPNYASLAVDAVADSVPEVGNVEVQAEETTKWCQQLKEQVGVMENRIRSNIARGRPVVNDTAIQGLFLRLTEYHAQVLERMHKLDEERAYYEGLQDHLNHIVDARSAVTQLREDNERRKKEQLEAEQRMRQAQMKQTLDLMRMKKHAMLLEQRDTALQRFQQQEQEMQARRQQYPTYGNTNYMQSTVHSNVYGNHASMSNVPYYQQQQYPIQQQYIPHAQMQNQYPQSVAPTEANPSSSVYSTPRSTAPVGQMKTAVSAQATMYHTPEYGNLHDTKNLSMHPIMRQQDQNGYNYQQYAPHHPTQQVSQAQHPTQQAAQASHLANGYGFATVQNMPTNVPTSMPEPSNETPLISFD